MDEKETAVILIDSIDMLYMSIIVLFLGMYLNKKIRFLAENYIPPAVTGQSYFRPLFAGAPPDLDVQALMPGLPPRAQPRRLLDTAPRLMHFSRPAVILR